MTKLNEFTQHIQDKDLYELYIYEQLIDADPDFEEALFPLAELYTQLGQYDKGLNVDLKLAQLYPEDCAVIYNLACSYSLCGQLDDAIDTLKKAIGLGWDDVEHMQTDPDLEAVRQHPLFSALLNQLNKRSR